MIQRPVKLCVVVPCYNEEPVVRQSASVLGDLLRRLIRAGAIADESEILFVDDGSRDRTWEIVSELAGTGGTRVGGLKLSRNRGHQNAVLAGLFSADADVVISIDADLQDDVEAIPKMLDEYARGSDIVYGVRSERTSDTLVKRMTAEGYYWLLGRMGVEIVFNHADYRLMSRRVIDALRQYDESNLFLRGIIPQIGFRSATVAYERGPRFAGESKYPLGKMLALAWQGISSFSAVPLRLITGLGLLVSIASIGLGFWALGVRLFTSDALPGWASTVIPLFLLSGVQLLSLGVIGEYVAKIYVESKRRPRFFVEQRLLPDTSVRTRSPEAFGDPAKRTEQVRPIVESHRVAGGVPE